MSKTKLLFLCYFCSNMGCILYFAQHLTYQKNICFAKLVKNGLGSKLAQIKKGLRTKFISGRFSPRVKIDRLKIHLGSKIGSGQN